MIVTKQEAKTKVCQESMMPALTMNNPSPGSWSFGTIKCIGPDCMAWCWIDIGADIDNAPRLGYCGKAGKP